MFLRLVNMLLNNALKGQKAHSLGHLQSLGYNAPKVQQVHSQVVGSME